MIYGTPCCTPVVCWPGATFTREYTRQRSTDCVGVPRLPPSTPRTIQQTLQRKSVREKEKRKREDVYMRMCVCVLARVPNKKGKTQLRRKTESHGSRLRERRGKCVRKFVVSADSCVFRVPNARNKRCLSTAT